MGAEQKVAVVTGASQGIGAALVRAFRDRDYRVVANSRSIGPSQDPDVLAIPGDVADPDTPAKIVSEALERFKRIDTLVNNAGIFVSKPFIDYSAEDLARFLSVNVAGFFHITQDVLPVMLAQGSGHIVTLTTTLAELANSKVPSVLPSLTKGGLNAATRALAIEYASRGIRVNAVSPGIIKTPLQAGKPEDVLGRMHPLGRMGEIRDITGAVLYLESAPFVTGEILHVDGGQSAGR